MRNIYWLFIVLVSIGFGACDADPEYFQEDDSYIAFNVASAAVAENATDELKIPVRISTVNPKNVTLDYEIVLEGIDAPAEEGVDYQIMNESKTLSFSSTQLVDVIRIKTIDNDSKDGDKQFVIKLKSNSAGINQGLADGADTQCLITISDDEHPLALILGNYVQDDYFTDGSYDSNSGNDMVIQADPNDDTKVFMTGFWGINDKIIVASVDIENQTMSILPGQLLFVHSTYGDCFAVSFEIVPDNNGDGKKDVVYHPQDNIECTIDENGNITTGMWAPTVSAGSFAYYGQTVFTKQ